MSFKEYLSESPEDLGSVELDTLDTPSPLNEILNYGFKVLATDKIAFGKSTITCKNFKLFMKMRNLSIYKFLVEQFDLKKGVYYDGHKDITHHFAQISARRLSDRVVIKARFIVDGEPVVHVYEMDVEPPERYWFKEIDRSIDRSI
jgi:hypothetical protein